MKVDQSGVIPPTPVVETETADVAKKKEDEDAKSISPDSEAVDAALTTAKKVAEIAVDTFI